MTWLSLTLLGITTILVIVLWDLVVSGGKWCARLAERIGLVARSVRPRQRRAL